MLLHQPNESIEQRLNVVRPRTRLRMALKAERRRVGARESLHRSVEERAMRDAQIRRQTRFIDREAMILTADHHAPAVDVEHRMVRAVMAEFHLYRARSGRQTEELMAEADAEDGDTGRDEPFDGLE